MSKLELPSGQKPNGATKHPAYVLYMRKLMRILGLPCVFLFRCQVCTSLVPYIEHSARRSKNQGSEKRKGAIKCSCAFLRIASDFFSLFQC